jgi:hypothetical protein
LYLSGVGSKKMQTLFKNDNNIKNRFQLEFQDFTLSNEKAFTLTWDNFCSLKLLESRSTIVRHIQAATLFDDFPALIYTTAPEGYFYGTNGTELQSYLSKHPEKYNQVVDFVNQRYDVSICYIAYLIFKETIPI